MGRILIVEDDENFATLVREILAENGYLVDVVERGEEALRRIEEDPSYGLMLLDLRLPGMEGMEVLRRALRVKPGLAVVIVSGHGDIQTAVGATKIGAFDFLEKPIKSERLLLTVQRAFDFVRLREDQERLLEEMRSRYRLVGVSPAMRQILSVVDRVARTDATVLITGESGTGKEMVARAIHLNSHRASKPFVQVNCAAIPDTLIESELFGHVKGAFTGALRSHEGKFQQANGGTLFLDEIGDLSSAAQSKLLRAIETREVTKIGGETSQAVDVRLIVATHRNLRGMVERGEFREDLYHRINVVAINIPPLRDRKEDIIPLAQHFLNELANSYQRPVPRLTPDAETVLMTYEWPGNVRELRNLMEKAIVLLDGEEIHGFEIARLMDRPEAAVEASTVDFRSAREAFERSYLSRQLQRFNWNVTRTAEAIGVERSHLYKMIHKLGIRLPANRARGETAG